MRNGRLVLAASVVAALLALAPQLPAVKAADHGDAPGVRVDDRLDINDVYAFQSPNQSGNVVFIVTVQPIAGITGQTTFHPTGDYDIFVNTNADPDYEFAFNFRFGPPGAGGIQELHAIAESRTTRIFDILDSTSRTIDVPGGGFIRANKIDDPFFFDLIAFRAGLSSFCPAPTPPATVRQGVNFFRGLDTLAIALELPRSFFGTNNIGVWSRTSLGGVQVDRMGRPAINTVFIPSAMKDAFNQANPLNNQAALQGAVYRHGAGARQLRGSRELPGGLPPARHHVDQYGQRRWVPERPPAAGRRDRHRAEPDLERRAHKRLRGQRLHVPDDVPGTGRARTFPNASLLA